MIAACPTTGEFCSFVALTEEGRQNQSDLFERCMLDGTAKKCGHYVMMAESMKASLEEGEINA